MLSRIAFSAVAAGLVLFQLVWRLDASILGAAALLLVAVVPWLPPPRERDDEVTLADLDELRRHVAGLEGAALSASRQAMFAVVSAEAPDPPNGSDGASDRDVRELRALSAEYSRTRRERQPGDARTLALTVVAHRMIRRLRHASGLDVRDALVSGDGGMRLVAYLHCCVRPDPSLLGALVESVTQREDTPFGQYWGLQALGRVLAERREGGVPFPVVRSLRAFATRLPPGTDRGHDLSRILREVGSLEIHE